MMKRIVTTVILVHLSLLSNLKASASNHRQSYYDSGSVDFAIPIPIKLEINSKLEFTIYQIITVYSIASNMSVVI